MVFTLDDLKYENTDWLDDLAKSGSYPKVVPSIFYGFQCL